MQVTKRGWGKNRRKSIFAPAPKLIILLAVLNSTLLTGDFSLPRVRQPTLGSGAKCSVSTFCPTPNNSAEMVNHINLNPLKPRFTIIYPIIFLNSEAALLISWISEVL